jgi:hypothetical protein
MKLPPSLYNGKLRAWETARDKPAGLNVYNRFELRISSMKMRRRVVIRKHADDDPVK